jgi:NitT/TauT family transport system substrate-binding protein
MQRSDPSRRHLLLACLGLSLTGLLGCYRPEPLVRVASNAWVGYEPLFLARELGYLEGERLRLVESSSNTTNLLALATGEVEAAALTLDEFLVGREGGLPIRVILLFDESAGADVVMARPEIMTLADLRGRRIGYEQTAVAALMLAKLLEVAQLTPRDVVKVPLNADRHLAAYRAGEVDALVTFEPHASRVARSGARRLLDSSRFPGIFVDVLAAREEALVRTPAAFHQLTGGFFRALDHLRAAPRQAADIMAGRLALTPDAVLNALAGVRFLDLAENHAWLSGPHPRLPAVARQLAGLLRDIGLLRRLPATDDLQDARFLPPLPGTGT